MDKIAVTIARGELLIHFPVDNTIPYETKVVSEEAARDLYAKLGAALGIMPVTREDIKRMTGQLYDSLHTAERARSAKLVEAVDALLDTEPSEGAANNYIYVEHAMCCRVLRGGECDCDMANYKAAYANLRATLAGYRGEVKPDAEA